MLLIAMLTATVWTMPSGQPTAKPASDRLPAPQVTMRWQVPSGLPAAKPDAIPANLSPVCQQTKALPTAKGEARTHRLDKEPAADGYAAVLYSEGNCTKPVKVSRDIGMNTKGTKKPATR